MKFLYDLMPYVFMYTSPLLIVALGALISERSGVVNIALEGLMIIGAFSSAYFISIYYPIIGYKAVWISILVAGISSTLISLFHAYASITLGANQIISGTAINMLAPALTIYLARFLTGTANITIITGIKRTSLPILSKIPILGPLFFTNAYLTTYFVIFTVFIVYYVIFKTAFGLRLRACGENPHSADSMGINVYRTRYIGVASSGLFAGIGGALFTCTVAGGFNGSVAGYGFLALASLIFGKWLPFNVLGAAFFFGFMKTLGEVARSNDVLKSLELPMELYVSLPYIFTILALVLFSKNTVAPKASGEPYDKGKR